MYFQNKAVLSLPILTTSYSRHVVSTVQTRSTGPDNERYLTDTDGAKHSPPGLKFLSFPSNFPEHPVRIVDYKTRVTRNHTSNFYKVQWSNHSEREATWETEEFVRTKCPELLQTYQGTHQVLTFHLALISNLGTRFLLGVGL